MTPEEIQTLIEDRRAADSMAAAVMELQMMYDQFRDGHLCCNCSTLQRALVRALEVSERYSKRRFLARITA